MVLNFQGYRMFVVSKRYEFQKMLGRHSFIGLCAMRCR